MQKKKVFISIEVPESIKKELKKAVEKLQETLDPSIRFSDSDSWHLTLLFLGLQKADDMNSINAVVSEIAMQFDMPIIRFEKITFGPVGRTPRMIWLVADKESSKALAAIKDALELRLFEQGVSFEQEHRQFTGHLTLARFSALHRETLPQLDIPFVRDYEGRALDLLESHSERVGMAYESLGKFDFEGDEG
jgi:2'-5' RNA ligase